MNAIKTYIFNHFKTVFILMLSVIISMFLLMVRSKITLSFFYLFLVWNLFLAFIPFAISTYLKAKADMNKYVLLFWLGIWLLFLPNAPYIVTDLIHLQSSSSIIWFDIFMVSGFAISGLLLFYFSILDIQTILKSYLSKRKVKLLSIGILFLSSFGVYLGRVLRYNSWELLEHPQRLFSDIYEIITQPNTYVGAWLFTLLFGVFLVLGFWLAKRLYKTSLRGSTHRND